MAVPEPRAQQASSRGLEDGAVDDGVAQDHARRHGSRHVARDRALAVDVDAVGRGEADGRAVHLLDVREHPRGRGLAVRARDGRDGDARRAARRKEHVDDGLADVARSPLRRRDVHSEAGRGVHLADPAAHLAVRLP